MKETVETLRNLVYVALDEIAGSADLGDFAQHMDTEINEALMTAALELSEELPDVLLMPKVLTPTDPDAIDKRAQPEGAITLPADFLRLVRLRLSSWKQDVTQLTDPSSNEAKMQASEWTRGTPQKPVAVLENTATVDSVVRRRLKYYTAGKIPDTSRPYDHTLSYLAYVPMPAVTEETVGGTTTAYLEAGIHDRAKPLLIYRACSIVMEGKQNAGLADRFRQMSAIGNGQ